MELLEKRVAYLQGLVDHSTTDEETVSFRTAKGVTMKLMVEDQPRQ